MGRVAQLRQRIGSEDLGPVMRRAVAHLRDRVAPPPHLIYWTPTDAPGSGAMTTSGESLEVARDSESLALVRGRLVAAGMADDDAAEFDQRLAAGARFHALLVEGRFAGSLYTVPGSVTPFQHVVLTPLDAMVLDARIDPAFRGRGLYSILLSETLRALNAIGIQRLYIDTPASNERSLATFRRLGFRFLVRYRRRGSGYRFDRKPL